MSAIAGVVYFDHRPVEPGQIEAMTSAMRARGPDGISHWQKGYVALGQCMLRSTPESLEESLPLFSEDESVTLVLDGRVDNYDELRHNLLARGAVLRTRADAELILRAYEVWGEDCPDRIVGEYVFFIWDARRQGMFAARDAAGTRHFYYHQGNGWFAFASEIKALLTLPIPRRLNEMRMLDFLGSTYDRDDEVGTFYEDILRMPAGHAMNASAAITRIWRWWRPGNLPEQRFSSQDECTEAFTAQLRVVTRCRLRSIKPVAAMLSGGLDSSTLVGLISKEFRGDLRTPLRTFSLTTGDPNKCPDLPSISAILQHDPWLQPTLITPASVADLFNGTVRNIDTLDEPILFGGSDQSGYIYQRAGATGCGTMLDGMAGDLHFHGFTRSADAIFWRRRYSAIPALIAACYNHNVFGHNVLGIVYSQLMRTALWHFTPRPVLTAYRTLKRHVRWTDARNAASVGGVLGMLRNDVAEHYLALRLGSPHCVGATPDSADERARHAENFTTGLLSYVHETNTPLALANGVDPRSPFSDRRMIEFSISMPLEGKLSQYWYKRTLRKMAVGLVPESVRWRRTIGGHPGPAFLENQITILQRERPDLWRWNALDPLTTWLDPVKLRAAWLRHQREPDYANGCNLYQIALLGRWLGARFDR